MSMCRYIGGMRTCILEDPFSPGKGAENKFMTRNGNWCVVKAVSYAPCPVEMILAHFEGVRNRICRLRVGNRATTMVSSWF